MAPTCRDFCLLALPFALLHVLLRPSPAASSLMPGAACAHESRWFEDVLFSLWALASGSGDNHAQNTLLYALIDALDATGMSMNNYGFAPAPRELGVTHGLVEVVPPVPPRVGAPVAERDDARGGILTAQVRHVQTLHAGKKRVRTVKVLPEGARSQNAARRAEERREVLRGARGGRRRARRLPRGRAE